MKACFVSRSGFRRFGSMLGSLCLTASGLTAPGLNHAQAASSAAAGALDPTFQVGVLPGTPTACAIFTFAIQNDDRILLGGSFSDFNGLKTLGLARLLPDGQVDTSYLP